MLPSSSPGEGGVIGRGLVERPRTGEPLRAEEEAMGAGEKEGRG
jgi:hypothetical protein